MWSNINGVVGLLHKSLKSIVESAWNGVPERVTVPYAKCQVEFVEVPE